MWAWLFFQIPLLCLAWEQVELSGNLEDCFILLLLCMKRRIDHKQILFGTSTLSSYGGPCSTASGFWAELEKAFQGRGSSIVYYFLDHTDIWVLDDVFKVQHFLFRKYVTATNLNQCGCFKFFEAIGRMPLQPGIIN